MATKNASGADGKVPGLRSDLVGDPPRGDERHERRSRRSAASSMRRCSATTGWRTPSATGWRSGSIIPRSKPSSSIRRSKRCWKSAPSWAAFSAPISPPCSIAIRRATATSSRCSISKASSAGDAPLRQCAVARGPARLRAVPAEPIVAHLQRRHSPRRASSARASCSTTLPASSSARRRRSATTALSCTRVTLGGSGKETGDRHPKIGESVLIGAGAKVLGNITRRRWLAHRGGQRRAEPTCRATRDRGGRPGQDRRIAPVAPSPRSRWNQTWVDDFGGLSN